MGKSNHKAGGATRKSDGGGLVKPEIRRDLVVGCERSKKRKGLGRWEKALTKKIQEMRR